MLLLLYGLQEALLLQAAHDDSSRGVSGGRGGHAVSPHDGGGVPQEAEQRREGEGGGGPHLTEDRRHLLGRRLALPLLRRGQGQEEGGGQGVGAQLLQFAVHLHVLQ